MQTKKQSLIESITNVLIGYIVAVISNAAILPLFGGKFDFWRQSPYRSMVYGY